MHGKKGVIVPKMQTVDGCIGSRQCSAALGGHVHVHVKLNFVILIMLFQIIIMSPLPPSLDRGWLS